jgi:hypothetical protein
VKKNLSCVIILLSVLSFACRAFSLNENPAGPKEPSFILYEEKFSDPNSGWENFEDENAFTGYQDDGYRIYIKLANWYYWVTAGKNFTDTIIEVDATKIGGPDNNELGVICRYKDDDNFYFFSISSDGFYAISKLINGELSYVGMDQMEFNEKVIKLGNATNHITVSCVGNNLTLSVNGEVLADVSDSDLPSGDVGLIASTFDEPGTDILFDNLTVSRP